MILPRVRLGQGYKVLLERGRIMVRCKQAEMFNMSVSMLFGMSPKVHFQCGNCGRWSVGRGNIQYVNRNGGLYIPCQCCGETNKIPCQLG